MITWTQRDYAVTGSAGGITLFTISWRLVTSDPGWVMQTSLPGYGGKKWKHDDKDELKSKAEKILAYWVKKVTES